MSERLSERLAREYALRERMLIMERPGNQVQVQVVPESEWWAMARPSFKPIAIPVPGAHEDLVPSPRYGYRIAAQQIYLKDRPWLRLRYTLDL